jgi:hypothetical protein
MRNSRQLSFVAVGGSYRLQQAIAGLRNFRNCPVERFLIRPGGFMKSGDLSHELQGSTTEFFRSCGLFRLS